MDETKIGELDRLEVWIYFEYIKVLYNIIYVCLWICEI